MSERLAGLGAADVMRREPFFGPGSWTVRALVEQLVGPGGSPVTEFVVVDFQGRSIGWLTLADLAAVPAADRQVTAVRDVVRPLHPERIVGVDTPAVEALRRPMGPGGLVVTQPDGRAVGVIGIDDLRRAVELQGLRIEGTPSRPHGPGQPAGLSALTIGARPRGSRSGVGGPVRTGPPAAAGRGPRPRPCRCPTAVDGGLMRPISELASESTSQSLREAPAEC